MLRVAARREEVHGRQSVLRRQHLHEVSAASRLASLLTRSWRDDLERVPSVSSEVLELAIAGGSGALAYRRLVEPPAPLRELYRHQVLEAARFEHGLVSRVKALRERRIEPLLIKGWSVARRYPEKGLRHFSDLDLVVAPEERADAERVVAEHAHDRLDTDLHFSIPHVEGRELRAIEARLVEVPLHDITIRTLGDEDHLWLLAQHALGHGLWRSVWLVDVALLAELALDWDYVFAGPPNRVAAVKAALALARDVLGARISISARAPRWAEHALYAEWGTLAKGYEPLTSMPRLRDVPDELRRRWPNALRATAELDAPWNGLPRLPFQLYELGRRLARFARAHDDPRGIWKK